MRARYVKCHEIRIGLFEPIPGGSGFVRKETNIISAILIDGHDGVSVDHDSRIPFAFVSVQWTGLLRDIRMFIPVPKGERNLSAEEIRKAYNCGIREKELSQKMLIGSEVQEYLVRNEELLSFLDGRPEFVTKTAVGRAWNYLGWLSSTLKMCPWKKWFLD